MPRETIESRVDNLERRVTELEKLPDRVSAVESQIVLLRTEMRSEFSETRQSLRQEIAETHRSLRQEIAEKHDEALRYMRVLHEEVIDRLKTMQEGQQPHPPSRFALRRASRPQNDS